MTATKHGTRTTYVHDRCRCSACREANRVYQLQSRARRAERLKADPSLAPHGRESTYQNWGCRCLPCTETYAKKNARDYAGRKQAAS